MEEIKKPPRIRWRTWLANLPPVDWDALAQKYAARRERWVRKGDKRPLEDVRRMVEARRLNRLARRKAALRRAVEARKFRKRVPVFSMRLRVLAAMQPGTWHTRHEIERTAGLDHDESHWKLHNLRQAGLIERRHNPGHKRISATLETPRFEFRLTEAGTAERERTSWMV